MNTRLNTNLSIIISRLVVSNTNDVVITHSCVHYTTTGDIIRPKEITQSTKIHTCTTASCVCGWVCGLTVRSSKSMSFSFSLTRRVWIRRQDPYELCGNIM